MKICKKCKIEKEIEFFYKRSGLNSYNTLCKSCQLEYTRTYHKENKSNRKEHVKEYSKSRYLDIKSDPIKYKKLRSRKNKYVSFKKKDDLYMLTEKIRGSIRQSFNKNGFTKRSRTYEILGCTYEEFKKYLESKFETWMTWKNRGLYNGELNYGWDIDHIIPSSSATTEEELLNLNHYTNLQPLCSKINRDIKRDL